MSFFIKGNPTNNLKRSKYSTGKAKKKMSKTSNVFQNEEITSSDEESNPTNEFNYSGSDEIEHETAQDKKLRLAKIYLDEIEKLETEKLEQEVNTDVISLRLKEDYLKQSGKFRSSVAHKYKGGDISSIIKLKCREQKNTVTCLCLTSNNEYLFSGSKDGIVIKWSLIKLQKVGIIPFVKKNIETVKGHNSEIICITLSSDDKFLVVGDESADIQVWDPTYLQHIKSFKGHKNMVTGVCFRKGTHTLYSCSKDRSIKVWNLDEMAYVETLYGHQDTITSLDALSRDRILTSGGRDTSIRIWKVAEESQLIYNGHSGSIDVVNLVNEDNFISGGEDGQLCSWSSMKKKPLCTINNAHGLDLKNSQPYWICSLASLVNTDLIASGSHDGTIKLWKLGNNFRSIEFLFEIPVDGFINSIVFTSDGKHLVAACGKDHKCGRWWNIDSAKNAIFIFPLIRDV